MLTDRANISSVSLCDVFTWSAPTGIVFDRDALITAGTRLQSASDTGLVGDRLVVAGTLYDVPDTSDSEKQLLRKLLSDRSVDIENLFGRKATALWPEKWRPSDRKLQTRLSTFANRLNNKLVAARVPLKIRVSVKNGTISSGDDNT